MGEEGDVMAYSRVEKYQELRDGLKDEAGINREKEGENVVIDEEDDDFLSFIKKDEKPEKIIDLEDTLTEAKTFEQMRQEGSKELEQALRSAKKGVGKESQFNTRMDILSKIREPEKVTIKIDSVDEYKTDEFARGIFLNESTDKNNEPVEEKPIVEAKKKMTLMERLASMSPEEDAKKAQEFLEEEKEKEVEKEIVEKDETVFNDQPVEKEETVEVEETPEPKQELRQLENEESYKEIFNEEENDDEEDVKKDGKIVKVLDVIITILVIVLMVLLGVIIYQNFF